ncbi:MAG: AmmeMemoRadiSam system protein B [Candidatus Omnitrophota bacterium]
MKEPNVAGAFYPSDADELLQMIQGYLKEAGDVRTEGRPLALIVPHAGYVYSGPVAAYGFKALEGMSFECVVVLAASHFYPFRGASVYQEGFFNTPLGSLEIDRALARSLIEASNNLLVFKPEVFNREHSLEVELPFLQASLKPGFKIVPILLGQMEYEECLALAQNLARAIGKRSVLVLVSTDLSHFKSYEEATALDQRTIGFLKSYDTEGLWSAVADTGWNVCGIRPVVTAMRYARLQGASEIQVLKYANSGDTAGDKTRVVGYVSAVIVQKNDPQGETDMLTKDDKKKLLEIARRTIEGHVQGRKAPEFQATSPGLGLQRGVFVTLHKGQELRGCIGLFASNDPLVKSVSEMAIASSTQDYRFSAVEPQELKDLTIEISVLSEPRLIDDWRKIRLGTDGVIIKRGFSSGVFLPQVATETGWDLDTFLGQLCSQKAGLPTDCYKNPGTKIYTFQADVFSEQAP